MSQVLSESLGWAAKGGSLASSRKNSRASESVVKAGLFGEIYTPLMERTISEGESCPGRYTSPTFGLFMASNLPACARDAGDSGLTLVLQPRVPGNKLTQDNAGGGVQFITQAGPRQSLLLAKDPDQFL